MHISSGIGCCFGCVLQQHILLHDYGSQKSCQRFTALPLPAAGAGVPEMLLMLPLPALSEDMQPCCLLVAEPKKCTCCRRRGSPAGACANIDGLGCPLTGSNTAASLSANAGLQRLRKPRDELGVATEPALGGVSTAGAYSQRRYCPLLWRCDSACPVQAQGSRKLRRARTL